MRQVLSEDQILELMAGTEDVEANDIVIFEVSEFRCAALAADVEEIVTLRDAMPIPGTKPWVAGCMKHGMGLLPAINLAHFLRATPTQMKSAPDVMLIKDPELGDPVGLIVNKVEGYTGRGELTPTSKSSRIPKALKPYIRSLCEDGKGEPCVLIDLQQLIKSENFRNLEI